MRSGERTAAGGRLQVAGIDLELFLVVEFSANIKLTVTNRINFWVNIAHFYWQQMNSTIDKNLIFEDK
jgi:hypothetical protein